MSARSGETVPRKAGRTLRWAKWVGGALCFVIVATSILYLARERLLAPWIIARAAEQVRAATGLDLRVERIGGNWWSGIELAGVELSGDSPKTELKSLSIARATARFDLLGLLRGDLDAIASIEVGSAAVEIDFDVPGRPRRPQREWDAQVAPFPWPAKLPPIDARDIDVRLALGGGRILEAHDLDATQLPSAAQQRWSVRARGAFRDPHFGERSGSAAGELVYRAGVFEVLRLDLGEIAFARELRLDLRDIERSQIGFGGRIERFGGELEFRGVSGAHDLEIWLSAREFELGRLWPELRLASSFAGSANLCGVFRLPLDAPEAWSAHAWGVIDSPDFAGHGFDSVDFAGSVDCDQLELREALLLRGANEARVADLSISFLAEDLGGVLRSMRGSAELELLDPKSIQVEASAELLRAADRVRRASLALEFSEAGVELRRGEIEAEVGGLTIERGSATWGDRGLPFYEGLVLDLDAAIAFADLAPLAALIGRDDVKGALRGTLALSGPVLAPSGRFRLAGKDLSVQGREFGRVEIEARADKRHVELTRLELDGELGRLTLSGDYDYASETISNARLQARTAALDEWSDGRARADFATVDATLEGPWRDPEIRASAQASALVIEGRSIDVLDLEAVHSDGCTRVERLSASVAGVAVEASGSVCWAAVNRALAIQLDRARLALDDLDLSLEAPLEIEVAADSIAVHGLRVAGSAGRATADVRWSALDQEISIEAGNLVPMKLLGPFLPQGLVIDGVQGSLRFCRSAQEISADVSMQVRELQLFEGSPLAAVSFQAQLEGREIALRQLVISSPGNFGCAVSGRIPTDPLAGEWLSEGRFELAGEVQVSDFASLPRGALGLSPEWRGDASANFRLDGTSSDLRGTVDAKVHVTGTPADSIWSRGQSGAFQFEAMATLGDELSLERAQLLLPGRGVADIDGRIGLRIAPKRWLDGQRPDWGALSCALDAKLSAQDLGFVAGMLSSVRRTGGALEGVLHLGGTFRELELTGGVDLERAEIRLNNALAAFENIRGRIECEGTRLRIVSLAGDYGAAPFEARGILDFGGHEPSLDLELTGQGILLAREEGLRLRADADLKLAGALSALELSGDVTVVDGRFSKEFALISVPGNSSSRRTREVELPFLRAAPWANIEFDVRVGARKPIRVDTNVARGTIEPRLSLRGSGAAPRLSGTLVIGSTRLKLPAATLEVTSGVLTFRGESSLSPDLDITAVTRVRGFDITAQVGGTSADPELLFTSSPPLASEELAVLVLTGQLPESALKGPGSEAAVETVVVYLGRDLLTRWLGIEGDSEDPISERLEFYRGAEVSQTGIESTEFIFRLTPNPKGKSRILYLRAEKDIYERFNYGVKLLFRFK